METDNAVRKFFVASALFFIWVTLQGAIQAQGAIHEFIDLEPAHIIVGAHAHIGLLGWVSLTLFGVLYYLVPRVSGKELSWPRLVNVVFWVWVISVTINAILMILAGIAGGTALLAGAAEEAIIAAMLPYLILVGIFSIVCAITAIAFAIQIIHTIVKKK